MKKLSERQAWIKLAEMCEGKRLLCPCGCGTQLGLCAMKDRLDLSFEIEMSISEAISKLPNKHGGFKWPLNASGFRARAKFCRAQAAKLKPKPRKAPTQGVRQ